MDNIKGLLIDIDGVLMEDDYPLSNVVQHFNNLKRQYVIRLLTNKTTVTLAESTQQMQNHGFDVKTSEIITAPIAAKINLKQRGIRRIYPVVNDKILSEFESFEFDDKYPEVVLVGDIGSSWSYDLMNNIFDALMNGAELIALHKGKFWKSEGRLQLDIGPFIAGLEFATDKKATIIGKPNELFFKAALEDIGLHPQEVLMVGDDINSDIGGAQQLGVKGVLVKTGKYNKTFVNQSSHVPEYLIESFAHLDLI